MIFLQLEALLWLELIYVLCTQEIPSAFTLSIQEALPNKAMLRDQYNNSWHVKVAKAGDTFYLQDGWGKFVKDNFINGGDKLVFEYYGKGLFNTKIYDSSGREKKGVGAFKVTNEEKKAVTKEDGDEEQDDEEREGKMKDLDEDEEEEDKDEDETNDNDDNYILVSETDDEGEEEIRTSNDAPIRKHGSSSNTSEKQSRCRRVHDIYGEEIFRAGSAPRPKNPYFITKINPGRKAEFYIPMDVIKVQKFNLPKEILLVDPSGRKWSARLKQWKDGRTFYRGGWRKLCKMNFVGDDDICICEFIKRGERFCLNISFVRDTRD
ncbi:B3 domain-containing protein [Sesamum alatum]|uniref:B3 domain-containing protein n=1 Tax=Sesamum alatum TaxID=300844 RepID=A0AAE1XY11_9LAMI|nr:B3 domain-containing protein [Sesamum alatum]